jgi:uncharacterized membrane protein
MSATASKSTAAKRSQHESNELCFPAWEQNISESERWMSLGAGAALVATGLLQSGLRGLLMSGIGASLVLRGMTGHCFGYQALDISTADQ